MSRKIKEAALVRYERAIERSRRRHNAFRIALISAPVALTAAIYSLIGNALPQVAFTADWDTTRVYPADISYGDPKAPVRITEYGSLTCIHCANFHLKAFEDFKRSHIDTGKVHFVFSHFPYDKASLEAASAVSCLPKSKQPDMLMTLFGAQNDWTGSADLTGSILTLAKLDSGDVKKAIECVTNSSTQQEISAAGYQARAYGVSATPTFIIGKHAYNGFLSAEVLGRIADTPQD